ncbi:MAG: signal peptide peptidase SppA [Chloroflexota bacterium]
MGILALLAAILIPLILIPRLAAEKIAVISLSGTITADSSSLFPTSTITPDLVRDCLTRAEEDKEVKAVVLYIDSPGGEVAPYQEILREIEKVKETKYIVVSMGGTAASGGYYIATQAHKTVALPTTMTGSIGVISAIPNIEGFLEKLGIQIEIFTGGKYKDMYQGLRELTPEEEETMQGMINEYYEQSINVVAEGRELSREDVRDLATGQIYTGTEAKELRLVDELGDVNTAIDLAAELANIEAPIVEYHQPHRVTLRSLLGLADAIKARISGLSAQDILLLEILHHNYKQPLFLYQS